MSYYRPYKYVKDESRDPIYKTYNAKFVFNSRLLPVLVITAGGLLFYSQIVMPFVYIKSNTSPEKVKGTVLGAATGFSEFKFEELSKNTSFSTGADGSAYSKENVPEYFYLSIEKLGIDNAKVETNAEHLQPDNALGHYPKSALPGQVGNSFIFGHSVLPVFYSPKNYKAIFSTLDKLSAGDIILIKYNNQEFKYAVESKVVKKPIEVDPLAEFKPKYLNESTITLMTCTPPGTKIMRLMVNAVRVN